MDYGVTIIGAGVVGLACAAKFSAEGKSVLAIERHPRFGEESSSRNSEVIHAGLYYPKGSLKAKLCVAGKKRLYGYCEKKGIEHKRVGKYIVATDEDETAELQKILGKAKKNGVEEIYEISPETLNEREPYVKAAAGLWSPTTGILDTHGLMSSLELDAIDNGADFAYKHSFAGADKITGGYELTIETPDGESFKVQTETVINAAGLDSDKVAEAFGIDLKAAGYELQYCKGHYFRIASSKKHLAKRLIYPVPPNHADFLGVHVTPELNGELKLGPDILYLDGRTKDYSTPESLRDSFYVSVARYLKDLKPDDLSPDQAGIRAKLKGEKSETKDFIIKEESARNLPGLINLIGIESPGLTCCLEIAELAYKKAF